MIEKVLLPFNFDVAHLQAEALAFAESEWIPHFNKGYYSGDWSAIPLRSVNGDPTRIFPDPAGLLPLADTIHLQRCPYIKTVIDTFQCDKADVRLLRLKAGSSIKEHKDFDLIFEDGEIRLHIPVATNDKMEFYLNKVRVVMEEGSCWYLNFSMPHSVHNGGDTDRIHLVIDCKMSTWMRDLFESATSVDSDKALTV
jgi:Aspartyl/Asparaginyl beta-hydroxylase.